LSFNVLKFIIRSLAQLILLLVFYLHLQDLVSLSFWLISFVAGTVLGLLMGHKGSRGGMRFFPALAVFMGVLYLLRLGIWVFSLQNGGGKAILLFDNSFYPLLIPLFLTWLFSFLAIRRKTFLPLEAVINGWLFFGLTWGQGHYELSLFSHPSILALVTAVFIFLEVFILVISSGARGWRRMLVFMLLVLLFIGGGAALFFNRYTEGAVSQGGGLVKPTL